jgi:signal transduction histidine kinase
MATQINKVAEINENTELVSFQNKVKFLEEANHIIVHNLRGVASNIKMLVEMLMKIYVYKDEESTKKAGIFSLERGLSFIGESSSSIINILSNLMKGIDVNMNNKLEFERCDICEIINNTSTQLNGFILEKKARIRLMLAASHVDYPKCYLESILYNFISNALKYSRPDVLPEITISTYNQNGRVVLSVKDNGLGLDLDKYGDRLFQFNQTFHEGHDSKGMGLYITKKQVESLGGNIIVKSKENEGCEFIVTF